MWPTHTASHFQHCGVPLSTFMLVHITWPPACWIRWSPALFPRVPGPLLNSSGSDSQKEVPLTLTIHLAVCLALTLTVSPEIILSFLLAPAQLWVGSVPAHPSPTLPSHQACTAASPIGLPCRLRSIRQFECSSKTEWCRLNLRGGFCLFYESQRALG